MRHSTFSLLRHGFMLFAVCIPLVLGGCAAKHGPVRAAGRFPESPALTPAKTLEQALAEGKNENRNGLSVSGGWGFRRGDACVLAMPAGKKRENHNSVPLERLLVQTRNEVEFTHTPPAGQRYTVQDYGTVSRTLCTLDGRMYAVWQGKVTLIPQQDAPAAGQSQAPSRRYAWDNSPRVVQREYWFDLTDTSTANSGAAAKDAAGRSKAAQSSADRP
ncbi:MAG: hypothetical protein FWG04_01455 [Desulfovibrionaceae bacterium]|nr:hypothetical protein [Desulfovibrionaceae bacterium]